MWHHRAEVAGYGETRPPQPHQSPHLQAVNEIHSYEVYKDRLNVDAILVDCTPHNDISFQCSCNPATVSVWAARSLCKKCHHRSPALPRAETCTCICNQPALLES